MSFSCPDRSSDLIQDFETISISEFIYTLDKITDVSAAGHTWSVLSVRSLLTKQ